MVLVPACHPPAKVHHLPQLLHADSIEGGGHGNPALEVSRLPQLLVKLLGRRLSNDCHMPNTSEEKAIGGDIALHLIDGVLRRKVRLSGCAFSLEANSMVVGKRLMLTSWLFSWSFWRHMVRMVALSKKLVKLTGGCSCRRARACGHLRWCAWSGDRRRERSAAGITRT